jgi:hypothetical protein
MVEKLVSVVIPIYKETLTPNEYLSLNQCIKVLGKHPIIFIGPSKLTTDTYEEICSGHLAFNFIKFDDIYFKDIKGYNDLMLAPIFYKMFLNYTYILVYQLDAYVFKDELAFWCDKNYDFIGAPTAPHANKLDEMQFLKNYSRILTFINRIFKSKLKVSNVGNGGFSLRKTKTCYWLVLLLKRKVKSWGNNNEDGFFKYWGNVLRPLFSLPSDDIALHFAIELSPEESLKAIGNSLPFGCHAFEKYEPAVWAKYLHS